MYVVREGRESEKESVCSEREGREGEKESV